MIKARVIIILIITAIEDESIVVIGFFLFISYSMINVDKLYTPFRLIIFFNCNSIFFYEQRNGYSLDKSLFNDKILLR